VWIQLVNALLFTFAVTQIAFLGHDFSHGQVFDSKPLNRFFGVLIWGLALGGSESVWYAEHNKHHEHVNHDGHDPDLNIPFLFKQNQNPGSYSFPEFVRRYQHILFFLSLPVWYLSKLMRTWGDVLMLLPSRRALIECALSAIHFVVLFAIVFFNLPILVGFVFLVTHIVAVGFYIGVAFAPNHKGEEITAADEEVTWLNQITSTRNLYPTFIGFHVLGGLDMQIEHHLFPGVPRYQYPRIQKLVKAFCAENNISYHETTWLGSMKEIYVALKQEAERAKLAQP
jgi:fatty acid desaturase